MAVDPVAAASVTPPQTPSANSAGAGNAIPSVGGHHHHHGHKGVAKTDQVELSTTATDVTTDGIVPVGTLATDRLREITQRLAGGGYTDPATTDRVAGKLIDSGEV